jgi:hypothetical protein
LLLRPLPPARPPPSAAQPNGRHTLEVAASLVAADPEFSAAAGQPGGSFLMTAAEYNLDEMKSHRVLHVVSAAHPQQPQHQQQQPYGHHHQQQQQQQPPPSAPASASASLQASPPRAAPPAAAGGAGGATVPGEGARGGDAALAGALPGGSSPAGVSDSEPGPGPAFSPAAMASTAASALAELGSRGAGVLAALAQPPGGNPGLMPPGGGGAAGEGAGALGDADASPFSQIQRLGAAAGLPGPGGSGRRLPGAAPPGTAAAAAGSAAPPPSAPAPVAAALLSNFARKVFVTVYADGPTRVLCFSDEPFAGGTAEEGGLQAAGYRLQQARPARRRRSRRTRAPWASLAAGLLRLGHCGRVPRQASLSLPIVGPLAPAQ